MPPMFCLSRSDILFRRSRRPLDLSKLFDYIHSRNLVKDAEIEETPLRSRPKRFLQAGMITRKYVIYLTRICQGHSLPPRLEDALFVPRQTMCALGLTEVRLLYHGIPRLHREGPGCGGQHPRPVCRGPCKARGRRNRVKGAPVSSGCI